MALAPMSAHAEIQGAGLIGYRWLHERSELGRFLDDPLETRLLASYLFGMRLTSVVTQRVGAEVELTVMPSESYDERASVVLVSTRAQIVANLSTGRIRPFVVAGGGLSYVSTSNPIWIITDVDLEVHAGAGCRMDLGRDWGLRFDLRFVAGPDQRKGYAGAPEAMFAVYGRFPWPTAAEAAAASADRDSDGVVDGVDKCPDQAGAVTREGCPGVEKTDAQVDAERAERAEEAATGVTPTVAPPAASPSPTGGKP